MIIILNTYTIHLISVVYFLIINLKKKTAYTLQQTYTSYDSMSTYIFDNKYLVYLIKCNIIHLADKNLQPTYLVGIYLYN